MLKVLIVEENAEECMQLRRLVDWQALGADSVECCDSGTAALEIILNTWPDLVFTDVRLTGMDGLELIRLAQEHGVGCEFVITSRIRRFEFAQSAMRLGVEEYLVKPLTEQDISSVMTKYLDRRRAEDARDINERFLRTRILLRNSFMEDFISNDPPEEFSLSTLNEKYHFRFEPGIFQTVILSFSGLLESVGSVFLASLAQSVRGRFDPICYEMIPYIRGIERLTLIFNYSASGKTGDRIPELMELLTEHMKKRDNSNVSFCIGIGTPESDIALLGHTRDTAERAVRCGMLRGRNKMYHYGAIRFDQLSGGDILTATLQNEMRSAADMLDHNAFGKAIHAAFAPISVYTDPAVIIDICRTAIDILCSSCREAGYISVSPADRNAILIRLSDAVSLASVISSLSGWAAERFALCVEERKNGRPVRDAQQYMRAHFTEPLTLEFMAKKAHLNASYFSIIFKKQTGRNFSDYLTRLRVDEAKRLLRNTNLGVSVISSQVGYADSKYFSRIFTKHVGVRPSAYRLMHG